MAGDGDPTRKPLFPHGDIDIDSFIEDQSGIQDLRAADDRGTLFYDLVAEYTISPFVQKRIIAAYRRSMEYSNDYVLSHEEQDRVLSGTLIYRNAEVAGEHIIDIPYTMKNGRKNYWIITTNVGDIVKKQ